MKSPLVLWVVLAALLAVVLALLLGGHEPEPVVLPVSGQVSAFSHEDHADGGLERRVVLPAGIGDAFDAAGHAAGVGALRIRGIHEHGEEPAAGMNLVLRRVASAEPAVAVAARCDAEGLAVIPRLPAGEYLLDNDREDRSVRFTIVAGRTTTALFGVARGVRVQGRVFDRVGEPILGAVIQLGEFVLDTTDRAGRFEVLDLPINRELEVRAAGFCAVPRVDLSRITPGEPLEFVLWPGATTIEGFVTAPGGMPVPFAELRIAPLSSGEPEVVVSTDDKGHFEAVGIRPGTRRVVVKARGYEDGEHTCEAVSGLPTPLHVVLTPLPPGVEPPSAGWQRDVRPWWSVR